MIKLLLLLGFLFILTAQAMCADRVTGKSFATRSEVLSTHGMAATSQPLATQVALDILKQGGNAIDAAIAANACLCLMEPTGCGLGGDLFAIYWDNKEQKLLGLNASGRSPQELKLEDFKKLGLKTIPKRGALSVSVPGCVDGWFELHKKSGSLPMSKILAPAIQYAEEGFPVSELIAHYMQITVPYLREYPGFLETFTKDGAAPKKGEIFSNPRLAKTLKTLAEEGRDAFYKGDIAHKIADYVQKQGGYLSYEDMAEHKSEWLNPVSSNYRGYDVWELPPNGQGIAALQILNILENVNLREAGFGSVEHLHYFIEAKKLAFEDRAKFYADPAFHKIPVKQLISEEYAKERYAQINAQQAARSCEAGHPSLEEGDTIYLTTADKDGNMVSLIQSNFRGMGSGMTPADLGFILQNRGELFNLEEGHFNSYAPNKRPFHTIIPAFVTKDGKPYISFGVMGGSAQPQMHAQIIINMIDFDMNLQEAGDAPRIYHTGSSQPTGSKMTDGGEVKLESGFSTEVIRELQARRHSVGYSVGVFGGYQAIMRDPKNKVYYGASESRKDGQAAGY